MNAALGARFFATAFFAALLAAGRFAAFLVSGLLPEAFFAEGAFFADFVEAFLTITFFAVCFLDVFFPVAIAPPRHLPSCRIHLAAATQEVLRLRKRTAAT
jgi:hypothetical protein